MKFEAFGQSPQFTDKISGFIGENLKKFELVKESGEHPIDNYLLFQKYSELVEKEISEFLKEHNITQDKFYEACEFAKDENVPCNFLDYVLSSIEYEDFYFLMADYKNMGTKDVNMDKINNDLQKK